MPQTPVLLLCILSGCVLALGCGGESPKSAQDNSNAMVDWTDDAGRKTSMAPSPQRIIPLAPNLTELLYAIGAGPQVVAVSIADDYPPQIKSLPRFSSFPMDYEALVALQPDILIATDAINNPREAEQFTSLGMPVLYYSFKTWPDIPRVMRALGAVAGVAEQAETAAGALEAQLAEIVDKTSSSAPIRTLFLIGSDQLYAFGKGNYIHEAITYAGGESLTATLDVVSPVLSEEFILTSKPDVIIGAFKEADQLLQNHPALLHVPAIVNNRVCTIEPSLLLRPGPRLIQGIREMARCLHPTLFTDVFNDQRRHIKTAQLAP